MPPWLSVLTCAAMKKAKAIELLGNSVKAAAAALGVTSSAISQWPDELPHAIENRVLAALARRHLPPSLIGADDPPSAEPAIAPAGTAAEVGHAAG